MNHQVNNFSEPASLGRRALALLIDGSLLCVPWLLGAMILPVAGAFFISLLYVPVLESSSLQATIGKYWMGIQVVNQKGGRIRFSTALLRYLVKNISTFLLFLGYVFALFTKRSHTLHDLASGTEVIYGRNDVSSMVDAWLDQLRSIFGRAQKLVDESPISGISKANSKLDVLERLEALRSRGAISEDEYEREKRSILAQQ